MRVRDEMRMAGLRNPRGQTTMEYALLAAVLVAALIGMQMYLKRSMGGRLRSAADSLGEQYAPRHTTSNLTTTVSSTTTTTSTLRKDQAVDGAQVDVMVTTTTIDAANPDTTTRRGTETVEALGTELWE